MSPIGFANRLMFDFRCVVIPRFLYCTKTDFSEAGEPQVELVRRIEHLTVAAVDLARALTGMRAHPTP